MRMLMPTTSDLAHVAEAIRVFPNAFGSVSPRGEIEPSVQPELLWMMFSVTPTQMADLWRQAGISTDETSSFRAMEAGGNHLVHIKFFKLKVGWFKTVWMGNVFLSFDPSELAIGCIVGRTQVQMWHQLVQFMAKKAQLHDGAEAALNAV
jgi:hypothetical protein